MGGTRKFHTKSRNGCSLCRRARVKCDEQAPRCGRCTSRSLRCDFEDDWARSRIIQPSWTQYSINTQPSSPLPLTNEQKSLFHHFVNSTSESLITYNISNSFWKMDVPREALQCNYLLSSILAFSTLHKTHLFRHSINLQPHADQTSDINRSLRLHQVSVLQFTTSVSSITNQNVLPAIAQASLSAAYSCALAQLLPTLTPADHVNQAIAVLVSIYKALHLFRGRKPWMRCMGFEMGDQDGPGMVEKRRMGSLVDLTPKARKLRAANDLFCDNEDEKALYETAITAFLDVQAHWSVKVPSRYMELLQHKRPMALLILHVFVLEDVGGEEERVPWFMNIWKEGMIDYMREYLGLVWTQYCELEVRQSKQVPLDLNDHGHMARPKALVWTVDD